MGRLGHSIFDHKKPSIVVLGPLKLARIERLALVKELFMRVLNLTYTCINIQ